MHTTTQPANRLATTFAIGVAVSASLLPLPANAVRSVPCPTAPASAEQPGPSGLLAMARATLGAWTTVPDTATAAAQTDPRARQPASFPSRSAAAPLTVAELDARVSRYRRLPSSPPQLLDGARQALAQRDVDIGADNQACQP